MMAYLCFESYCQKGRFLAQSFDKNHESYRSANHFDKAAFNANAQKFGLKLVKVEDVSFTSKLKTRNDELIEFSYRISHDLRSPIKSLSGLINFIEEKISKEASNEVTMSIQHMKSSAEKLESLTEDEWR